MKFQSLQEYNDSTYISLILNESLGDQLNLDQLKEMAKKVKDKKGLLLKLIQRINEIGNYRIKKRFAALIIFLFSLTVGPKILSGAEVEKSAEKLSHENHIGMKEIEDSIEEFNMNNNTSQYISIGRSPEVIGDLNSINPNRFSTQKIDHYDQYDAEIARGVEELKSIGENPDAKLIKAIMMVETGMNPVKNSLGYEGFPQTKEHIINGWTDKKGNFHPGINQRYNTSFTMEDMYDPQEAAKFIHYMIKDQKRSKYINNDIEAMAAYNWGLGNWINYKRGNIKSIPKETADYMDLVSTLVKT